MTGTIFVETLRRHWRGMLIWGLVLASVTWMQVVIIPDVDTLQQVADMIAAMPGIITAMLGTNDASFFATPEGYLASQFYGIMLIIFGIYALNVGMNVTANDEERGIMDVQMSLPITRGQLVLEKTLAFAIMTIGVILLSFAGLVIGVVMTPALVVDMGKLTIGTLNMIPGSLVILAFTVMVGAVIRRKNIAIGVAAAFIFGSYFLDTLGRSAPGSVIDQLRALSFYSYYDGTGVIQNGLSIVNVLILSVLTVVLVVISIVAYRRRDIGL